ncbi:MAG TPA: aminodeoxychorismate lyase, partial [Flavobacterium alvei]|nr:aminodeoxychorismate lyase [Flavobacterium alvei]
MNLKKIITIATLVVITGLLIYGGILANQIFSKNTKFSQNEVFVFVPTGATYDEVKIIIEPFVDNMDRFEMVANKRSYP